VLWPLGNHLKKTRKPRRIRTNVVIMILVILSKNYSTYFKLVALKPKRAKIGIPTTEVIGETTVNGSKNPSRIRIDTGSSSSIILKRSINKRLLVKNSRTTTEWTHLRGEILYEETRYSKI
jgi:hypothetical protein